MELLEAITARRSIGRVKPDPVAREVIEKLLDAAVWAPNHHLTEPWRFFVLTGAGRNKLGQAYADIASEKLADPTSAESLQALDKEAGKAQRAPVIIAAACVPDEDPLKGVPVEELAAVSAAIQNLLLAAHEQGLHAVWRTGHPAYHPTMKQLFGLREQDTLLGLIYLGYPVGELTAPAGKRTAAAQLTQWWD